MAKILIIDDDKAICNALANAMHRMGHDAEYALTLDKGLAEASSGFFDVVFLDVRLPDGNGLNLLPKIREVSSSPEVIIITGEGDPDGAELAIKSGAWDYIEKPPSLEGLTLPLTRAIQYRQEKKTEKPAVALWRDGIIGSSPQMKSCLDILAKAANSDAPVLVTGETGGGKELFSHAIHLNSSRRHKNFVVVDCTALPETLVESTLFGYEKGAFTGADKNQDGLIRQADGGTLFLDEVGELPLVVQKAFLRVLQEHRFRPVGGKLESRSNFRLVAATHRDLKQNVKSGRFRQDLLFRLLSINIDLPPLRERTGDIRELALYFMNKFSERDKKGTKGFSPEFIQGLTSYRWPGNVRELANAMENILVAAGDDHILFPKHLPTHIRIELACASLRKKKKPLKTKAGSSGPGKWKEFREAAVSEAEEEYLVQLMSSVQGDIKEACQMSGLSRPRLYALLKKYNISRAE
ncbi:MAG: sigma-54-dependent Fis family transcriptional regulator [Desulfobacterales bacterium]|nr:sigma-54-dependent Fis family transcriptional regulator [Desulfobacterales bacterium]